MLSLLTELIWDELVDRVLVEWLGLVWACWLLVEKNLCLHEAIEPLDLEVLNEVLESEVVEWCFWFWGMIDVCEG